MYCLASSSSSANRGKLGCGHVLSSSVLGWGPVTEHLSNGQRPGAASTSAAVERENPEPAEAWTRGCPAGYTKAVIPTGISSQPPPMGSKRGWWGSGGVRPRVDVAWEWFLRVWFLMVVEVGASRGWRAPRDLHLCKRWGFTASIGRLYTGHLWPSVLQSGPEQWSLRVFGRAEIVVLDCLWLCAGQAGRAWAPPAAPWWPAST
jgi:hypothetical protein